MLTLSLLALAGAALILLNLYLLDWISWAKARLKRKPRPQVLAHVYGIELPIEGVLAGIEGNFYVLTHAKVKTNSGSVQYLDGQRCLIPRERLAFFQDVTITSPAGQA